MVTHIDIVIRPDDQLIRTLSRRAGMRFEQVNHRFFDNEHNILLVAFKGGEPLGFLYAYCLERMERKRPMMFLYAIDVFAGYKRQGIGTQLIEKLKEVAEDMGCTEIFVLTNDHNKAAKALYQKCGGVRENTDDVMFVMAL